MMLSPVYKPALMAEPDYDHQVFRGLECWLPFNEGYGLTAHDISGHGRHGRIVDPFNGGSRASWPVRKRGHVRFFEGHGSVGHYIDLDYPDLYTLPSSGPFSMAVRYMPFNLASSNAMVAFNGSDDLMIYPNSNNGQSGGVRIFWRDVGGSHRENTTNQVFIERTLLLTSNGANRHRVYLDGELDFSFTNSAASAGPFDGLWLGGWEGSGSQNWRGNIYDFRLWSREITRDEGKAINDEPYAAFAQKERYQTWWFLGNKSSGGGPGSYTETVGLASASGSALIDQVEASEAVPLASTASQGQVSTLTGGAVADYYVATTGNDSNDGSSGSPFLTIAKALTVAQAGDTVSVGPGRFFENGLAFTNAGTLGNPITIVGTLNGSDFDTIVDGSTLLTGWTEDVSVGSGVYKSSSNTTKCYWVGVEESGVLKDVIRSRDDVSMTKASNAKDSWHFAKVEVDFWDATGAFWMGTGIYTNNYTDGANPGSVWLRFKDGDDPTSKTVRYSGDVAVFDIQKSHIVLKDMKIQGARRGVDILGATTDTVTLENIEIPTGAHLVKVREADNVTFDGCHFHETRIGDTYLPGPFAWNHPGTDSTPASGTPLYVAGVAELFFKIHKEYCGFEYGTGLDLFTGGSQNITVRNCTIENIVGDAIRVQHAENVYIHDNILRNCANHGVGVSYRTPNVRIYDNQFSNNGADNFRNWDMELNTGFTRSLYAYRNRCHLNSSHGTHYTYHMDDAGTPANTNTYIYHNSFSGGFFGHIFPTVLTSGGDPNWHFINNVLSLGEDLNGTGIQWMNTAKPVGAYAYNHVGYDTPTTIPTVYNDDGNILDVTNAVWTEATTPPDFTLPALHAAREAGIDLSTPQTINGNSIPALPGMSPGYYTGLAPHMGAIQEGQSGGGGMPGDFVIEQTKYNDTGTTGKVVTTTFDSTPTQGNMLIAIGGYYFGRTSPATSFAIPGFTEARLTLFNGFGPCVWIGYKVAGPSEPTAHTLTVTDTSSSQYTTLVLLEVGGIDTNNPIESIAGEGGSGSATSRSSGTSSALTNAVNMAIAAWCSEDNPVTGKAYSNGFTEQVVVDLLQYRANMNIATLKTNSTSPTSSTLSWTSPSYLSSGSLVVFNLASTSGSFDDTVGLDQLSSILFSAAAQVNATSIHTAPAIIGVSSFVASPGFFTNHLLNSENFQGTGWSQIKSSIPGGYTFGPNVVLGPDGVTMNGTRLVEDTDGQNFVAQSVTLPDVTVGNTHNISVWLRLTGANEGNGQASLRISRVDGNFEIGINDFTLTSSWVRYSVSHTWAETGHTGILFLVKYLTGGPTEIYISQAQAESGGTVHDYIKTGDSAVRGASDILDVSSSTSEAYSLTRVSGAGLPLSAGCDDGSSNSLQAFDLASLMSAASQGVLAQTIVSALTNMASTVTDQRTATASVSSLFNADAQAQQAHITRATLSSLLGLVSGSTADASTGSDQVSSVSLNANASSGVGSQSLLQTLLAIGAVSGQANQASATKSTLLDFMVSSDSQASSNASLISILNQASLSGLAADPSVISMGSLGVSVDSTMAREARFVASASHNLSVSALLGAFDSLGGTLVEILNLQAEAVAQNQGTLFGAALALLQSDADMDTPSSAAVNAQTVLAANALLAMIVDLPGVKGMVSLTASGSMTVSEQAVIAQALALSIQASIQAQSTALTSALQQMGVNAGIASQAGGSLQVQLTLNAQSLLAAMGIATSFEIGKILKVTGAILRTADIHTATLDNTGRLQ